MNIHRFSCISLAAFFLVASFWTTVAQAEPTNGNAKSIVHKVQTLASGVVVDTKSVGTGARPNDSSIVKVHYRGTLDNGKEFDSSYARGNPAVFPLNAVIPCWTQGVATMAVGGKTILTCPADTAYGEKGAGTKIPPNSRLTFEVELLDILR